jgi:hypothetical protein
MDNETAIFILLALLFLPWVVIAIAFLITYWLNT